MFVIHRNKRPQSEKKEPRKVYAKVTDDLGCFHYLLHIVGDEYGDAREPRELVANVRNWTADFILDEVPREPDFNWKEWLWVTDRTYLELPEENLEIVDRLPSIDQFF